MPHSYYRRSKSLLYATKKRTMQSELPENVTVHVGIRDFGALTQQMNTNIFTYWSIPTRPQDMPMQVFLLQSILYNLSIEVSEACQRKTSGPWPSGNPAETKLGSLLRFQPPPWFLPPVPLPLFSLSFLGLFPGRNNIEQYF